MSSTAIRTAPRQEQRVLARIQHAREIIQRRIGIGATHGLMQRRDQIVVTIRGLVVDRRAALQILQLRGIENLIGARGAPDLPPPASVRRVRRHRPYAPARRASASSGSFLP
jgi:hypothetical protein